MRKKIINLNYIWPLFAGGSLLSLLVALSVQHIGHLAPCKFCIYERLVLCGVLLLSLIMVALHKLFKERLAKMVDLGGISLSYGLFFVGARIALEHITLVLDETPAAVCNMFLDFPAWLPLNRIAPWLFEVYGECGGSSDVMISMPFAVYALFLGYSALAILAFIWRAARTD